MSLTRLFITILFVAAGFGVIQLQIRPLWDDINRIKAESANVTEAIKNAQEVIRLRDELQSRFNDVSREDKERIQGFLPAKSEVVDLMIDVDILAKESNVTISSITFQESAGSAAPAAVTPSVAGSTEAPTPTNTGIKTLGLNFTVAGDYNNILAFMRSLENNLRIYDISSVSFTSTDKDEFQFSIQGRAYYQEQALF